MIEFFYPVGGNAYNSIRMGDIYPYSQRNVDHIYFTFKIKLKPRETKLFFIGVSSKYNVTILDPVMHLSETFIKSLRDTVLINGIFYGFMIIMLFYNLALYVQLKEKVKIRILLFSRMDFTSTHFDT